MESEATAIAVLQANYLNLTDKIDKVEIKVDKMSEKLDNLAVDFQKFGGLYNQQINFAERINVIENWKVKVEPKIEEICFDRNDRRTQLKAIGYDLLKMGIVALVSVAGSSIWITHFSK